MVKYTVASFMHGKMIKDETGLLDYGTAIMMGNDWIKNGVHILVNGSIAVAKPHEIMLFEVDNKNEHTVIMTWDKQVGGVL